MTLDEIKKDSPKVEGSWEPGRSDVDFQMAYYSAGCCWWTSFPEDLGSLPPMSYNKEKQEISEDPDGHSLPCCPHCSSVLYQGALDKFIKSAEDNPDHYGPGKLETFVKAHSRNINTCHRNWSDYA